MNKLVFWKDVKRDILGSSNWVVHLDKEDLNNFEDSDNTPIMVLESSTIDSSDKRFSILSKRLSEIVAENNPESFSNMIIFIQFPISNPITMTEMGDVNRLVDKIIPDGKDCEIRWGLSPREDNELRIVCAMK